MRKLIIFVLILTGVCFGQTPARFDIGGPIAGVVTTSTTTPLGYLVVVPGVKLNWCAYPANSVQGVPCTNYAPTYTSSTLVTQCPSTQPITLQGSNICQSASDNSGNIGAWYDSSVAFHSYTLTSGSVTYGPYTYAPGGTGGGGGGGGGPTIPPGITYVVTSAYWSQVSSTALTGGSPGTVTLTPCPAGVDYTSGAGYNVYIADGSNSEAVNVTSGSTGTGNCAITFTPFFSHTSYTIGSASSGIQETINTCGGISPTTNYNVQCNVTIPANGPYVNGVTTNHSLNDYNVYGTIFFHTSQSVLNGDGVSLNCFGRGPCLQMGDRLNPNHYAKNIVRGINFRSPTDYSAVPAYAGVAITNTATTSGVQTIATATAHGLRIGDLITILFTDDNAYWGDAVVLTVPTSTTFTVAGVGTIASQGTPGIVALAYSAILDNGNGTSFFDIHYDQGAEQGHFNNFFDFWDDENALIDHFDNNSINLNANANWTGSFIFSGGAAHFSQQFAPVITLRNSAITAVFSNGVTDYNSNGLYIDDSVIQSTSLWELYSTNKRGNYQGVTIKDLYNNGSICCAQNPASPIKSPFPGLGSAGMIAGISSGVATFKISGNGGVTGNFPIGGAGATAYTYYVVANDWTGASCGSGTHTETSPMQILNWSSTGSDNPVVKWPRVANGSHAICYDVLRMASIVGPTSPNLTYPYLGGCGGGAGGVCGSVATGITQTTACSGTLVCTYTDTGLPSTSAYTVNEGNYVGNLNFWPGALVVQSNSSVPGVIVDVEQFPVVAVGTFANPAQYAQQCSGYGVTSGSGFTSCIGSPTSFNNAVTNQTATLMTDGADNGGTMTLSKGRLNFSQSPYSSTLFPHHIITLLDSQSALTRATLTYRPPASANDVWIGTDVAAGGVAANLGKLAFGAPVAISHYIGNTGDNTNWLERMTASLKEFNVPVKMDQTVTIVGLANGCLNVAAGLIGSSGVSCGIANVMTLLGDSSFGGSAGAPTRLAGPTSPNGIAQVLISTPSGGVATAQVWAVPGVQIDAQTGTTYTIPVTDDSKFLTGCNSSPTAWTGFALANNYVFSFQNICAGLITFTPASGTVNGNATQIIPQNWAGSHYTDNTNTRMPVMPTIQAFPNTTGGQALGFNSATGQLSAVSASPCLTGVPTISSGFGTSPSVSAGTNACAFRINVGTGGTANQGIIGLPTAATGWNCYVTDLTTQSPSVFYSFEISSTTTTATVRNINNAATVTAWVASDILAVSCSAY